MNLTKPKYKNRWSPISGEQHGLPFKTGPTFGKQPDRPTLKAGHERSIITSIITRIAVDVASIDFQHVRVDDDGRYVERIDSNFDKCLNRSANLDQSGREMIQDGVMKMLDNSCVAFIPTDFEDDPNKATFDIYEMRCGIITEWAPTHVNVRFYNPRLGEFEERWFDKKIIAIVPNPFAAIMNEPNSTMQRLVHKLALLDQMDEQISSNKLNIVIQLPYAVKTEMKEQQAEERRTSIENQLVDSKYGIAYIGNSEKLIQLNRPVENAMTTQIESLTSMLYSQLGMTPGILDGTADENTMNNYMNRIVGVIATAITDSFNRKYLLEEIRENKECIMFFMDPFRLIPLDKLSKVADTFTRNEILSSNEVRQRIGFKPSKDPNADQLRNANISAPGGGSSTNPPTADQ